ncbi:MAG: bifunctional UDP-N-acetylmuramoyl-tripeptide:D-alanyl-D-alanine ligase/alanine racemase [Chitinophagales bacterium]|nr:bifunctional UDP-N-acetylmuramoyl-tripeptide:D-alanyl-D-alanine ligase/alanine racemase [Bacteroidota bacterium]MCB9256399.1 bifunctional UDP-N-acetylmuramoyl-tripeptide:D-alanyl-D-alanine ligase/alanine racemase [Chitinophagales bacterium]
MYTISEIQKVLKGTWTLANPNSEIVHILQDSRKLVEPSTTLFFAIVGERLDGHEYLAELYDKGLRNFVVQKEEYLKDFKDCNVLLTSDSRLAMQDLAAHHRRQFQIPVVAITGSNGKTIVKEWCNQVLEDRFTICRSPKSYNSQIGVPLSVWSLNEKHNLAIFEAGISEPGEMSRLEKIIQANIGIFTTIGSAHSENFISDSHKIKEKLNLFLRVDTLIFCADIPSLNQNISVIFGKNSALAKVPKLLSWGKHENVSIRILEQESQLGQTQIRLSYQNKEYKIVLPFADYSSVQNAMHCVALMLHFSYKEKEINARLKLLQRVAMRLEQKKGINDSILINDSYNSDLDSLKIALEFLQQQQQSQNKTLILSDILQSGMTGIDLYTEVNDLLLKNKITRFIGIGPNLERHALLFRLENFTRGLYFFESTKAFLASVSDDEFDKETILLKGARKFEFEKISAALEEKAHATIMEIDLNALYHNLKFFSSKLKPGTKTMAMVKAFSYGAGSVEVAKLLEFNRVDYLGVAYADEGIALRKAGITLPILVLNPEERSFNAIIKFQLEPEIYSLDLLHSFREALSFSSYEGKFPIHIDVDTGMKRLGFEKEEVPALCDELKNLDCFEVKSIFSHLAASDEEGLDAFTEGQIALFDQLSKQLMQVLPNKPLLHIANSSGISRFPKAHYDMVRLGIGLYGFNSEFQEHLQTVARLKTKISQIKKVAKGESVGYGRKGKAKEDITIATIAIGYADGLNRLLSNGLGEVFVKGKRAPIIGNVCMDMAMIDITDIEGLEVGDLVEIFGDNISAAELAQKLNTIPYEVLTSVSERVKRVFFMD